MSQTNQSNHTLIIRACKKGNRMGQRKLYELFYSYGISVALRYAKDRQEAQEVLNDSFIKVFKKIEQFDEQQSFKGWFRTIIINTSIDYHRKNNHFRNMLEVEDAPDIYDSNLGWDKKNWSTSQRVQKMEHFYGRRLSV